MVMLKVLIRKLVKCMNFYSPKFHNFVPLTQAIPDLHRKKKKNSKSIDACGAKRSTF